MSRGHPPWTVYGLVDDRSDAVFYVGYSHQPKKRIKDHRGDPSSSAWRRVQDIIAAGSTYSHVVFGVFESRQEARSLEHDLILLLPNLSNRVDWQRAHVPTDIVEQQGPGDLRRAAALISLSTLPMIAATAQAFREEAMRIMGLSRHREGKAKT